MYACVFVIYKRINLSGGQNRRYSGVETSVVVFVPRNIIAVLIITPNITTITFTRAKEKLCK